jgi:hypothetical protein
VIEADLKVARAEHDFQDAFKKWQKLKGTTLRVMVASRSKVSFRRVCVVCILEEHFGVQTFSYLHMR